MNTYFSSDERDRVRRALALTPASTARERTIDLTTTGARSGRPRRIEIWLYRVGAINYLTTSPARRDWYANVRAHPQVTLHLRHGIRADVPATGTPVLDLVERERIFRSVIADLTSPSDPAGLRGRVEPLEAWMAGSPLVRLDVDVERAA